jgi:uroporphyrinogen decarboxylase
MGYNHCPMKPLKNDRFIRALLRQPVDVTPIWIMRQAGRYLPEYREVRAKAGSFLNLCKTPELACEVTLQPIRRFPLDAAIVFSDILTIPDAMGLGLHFIEGEGPQFAQPIRSAEDVKKLGLPDVSSDLRYVTDAVSLVRRELDGKIPLIGFSGSPWTLATYMIEGGASKHFNKIKSFLFNQPAALHQLLDLLARAVTDYLNAQIAAGAQAVMIFDTWGGLLTTPHYQTFSLNYMKRILRGLHRQQGNSYVPAILFTKNSSQWLDLIADSGCDACGVDWTIDIGRARSMVKNKIALQGNMDPGVLYGPAEFIEQEALSILKSYGDAPGHVFNLGHGIPPDISPEKLAILVETVHGTVLSSLPTVSSPLA